MKGQLKEGTAAPWVALPVLHRAGGRQGTLPDAHCATTSPKCLPGAGHGNVGWRGSVDVQPLRPHSFTGRAARGYC